MDANNIIVTRDNFSGFLISGIITSLILFIALYFLSKKLPLNFEHKSERFQIGALFLTRFITAVIAVSVFIVFLLLAPENKNQQTIANIEESYGVTILSQGKLEGAQVYNDLFLKVKTPSEVKICVSKINENVFTLQCRNNKGDYELFSPTDFKPTAL